MKRFIAVILLSVHLFTAGGYAAVFEYFIHQSDIQIVKEAYYNKEGAKLIEIKIPVHLPGVQVWGEYEHIEGQLQLKGAFYNYVRLKMGPDTMALICVANTVKTRLVNSNIIIAKQINDVPLGKKAHNASAKKAIDSQFFNQVFCYHFTGINKLTNKHYDRAYSSLLNPFVETRGQPPDYS